MPDNAVLHLEVAQDYALLVSGALEAVEVKDTYRSGTVTLHSSNVRKAIANFVTLQQNNPSIEVHLRFLTTSEIGSERGATQIPPGQTGIGYWRACASGADVQPMRQVLEDPMFPQEVRSFCQERDGAALRRDLFQRIHWDCGRPCFSVLRQELEDRLLVACSERLGVRSQEVSTLSDLVLALVLRRTIVVPASSRVLRKSDLYRAIDHATQMSVPRAFVRDLQVLVSDVLPAMRSALGSRELPLFDPGYFIDTQELPVQRRLIPRKAVTPLVMAAMRTHGVCVLYGSSGVGKSTVARAVAEDNGESAMLVSFRGLSAEDARMRLDLLLARMGESGSRRLVLEDLNVLHDTGVRTSAGRLVEAVRRRALTAVLTCYERPSAASLATLSLGTASVVQCGYFSEEETRLLVEQYGGDPDMWGMVAHMTGGSGHPQLVHAFVRGTCDRGWPASEAKYAPSAPSVDIDEVRSEARRQILEALPCETRTLLDRLSVALVHFNRTTAMAIGRVPAGLTQIGERFDSLVGAWIEPIRPDLFRVSPLAADFGKRMLGPTDERRVHAAIAVETMKSRRLVLSDANGILIHALEGKSEKSLVLLAWSVLSARGDSIATLSDHFSGLSNWPTTRPVFEESPAASVMLRIAQIKLLIASRDRSHLTEAVAMLQMELGTVVEPVMKQSLEAHGLVKLLTTSGIANYVDNWVEVLLWARDTVASNATFAAFAADIEAAVSVPPGAFLSVLFAIGSTGIQSVARLEEIMGDLDGVDAEERAAWLRPVDEALRDYSGLVGSARFSEYSRKQLDAVDAAERYGRMADMTRGWKIQGLSLQCSIAQAVLLDEYEGRKAAALEILDRAESFAGREPMVLFATARLHYQHGEYAEALRLFSEALGSATLSNTVDLAHVFREAAICAGQCGQWMKAEEWFGNARNAAARAQMEDMDVMAVALEADAAGAALLSGNVGGALRGFANALEAVDGRQMPETLRADYCQKVVGHAAIWCSSRVREKDYRGADGQPLLFVPGTCSNPDPSPEIRRHPLVPSDSAWYMLAQAEAAAGVDVGIGTTLAQRLSAGRIPALEAGLLWQQMAGHVDRLDADGVARQLVSYLEGAVYLLGSKVRIERSWDPMEPERGDIPALTDAAMQSPLVEVGARRCILAYAISAVCAGRIEAIDKLACVLRQRYGKRGPGTCVLEELEGRTVGGPGLDETVIATVGVLRQERRMGPEWWWGASLALVRWTDDSDFKEVLVKPLAGWLRREWTRIVEEDSCRLARPEVTVPPVREVLGVPENNRRFVLRLLRVTLDAAVVEGVPRYHRILATMAHE